MKRPQASKAVKCQRNVDGPVRYSRDTEECGTTDRIMENYAKI